MKLFKQIVATAMVLFINVSSFAISSKEDVSYSGYYVDRIINTTTNLLINKNLVSSDKVVEWYKYEIEAEDQQADGMLPVFSFFDFENSFMNYCISKGFITFKQSIDAIEKSKHCGGLTLNGYNLLVLHTTILWALVVNKHITLKEAQTLLDSCRKEG